MPAQTQHTTNLNELVKHSAPSALIPVSVWDQHRCMAKAKAQHTLCKPTGLWDVQQTTFCLKLSTTVTVTHICNSGTSMAVSACPNPDEATDLQNAQMDYER
jgi:hypothetical protein